MKKKGQFKDEVRRALADYMGSEGCSCCRGDDHEEHKKRLAELLDVTPREDGIGEFWFDFSKFRSNG